MSRAQHSHNNINTHVIPICPRSNVHVCHTDAVDCIGFTQSAILSLEVVLGSRIISWTLCWTVVFVPAADRGSAVPSDSTYSAPLSSILLSSPGRSRYVGILTTTAVPHPPLKGSALCSPCRASLGSTARQTGVTLVQW